MCKPHKMNGAGGLKLDVHKVGFGKIRDEAHAKVDLKTEHDAQRKANRRRNMSEAKIEASE